MLCKMKSVNITSVKLPTPEVEYAEVNGCSIQLSLFHTGKGIRRLFICPACGGRVMTLYFIGSEHKIACRRCSVTARRQYRGRTCLDDQAPTELIDYKINRLENRLDLIREYSQPFYYTDYLNQKPKGMHHKTFLYELVRLQLLYELRDEAKHLKYGITAEKIKERTSDIEVELFLLIKEQALGQDKPD